jgi:transposase InsO family protein
VNSVKPSQQKLELIPLTLFKDLYPMAEVGADLYKCEKNHYLILVDWLSGFPFVHKLGSQTTDTIIKAMEDTFVLFGRPGEIQADNRPCFRTDFKAYCKTRGITANKSSPYKSSLNGLAEKARHFCKTSLYKHHS